MAGQLIAAEVMNDMQRQIRADIDTQVHEAVDAIEEVPRAEDATKLEGQSLAELTQAIIDQAISQMAVHSGYMRVFKILQIGRDNLIEHNLKNNPLVDLYQLDYFQAVASEDDDRYVTWVNFYLYHTSEKRIRHEDENGTVRVDIEPSGPDAYPFRIKFTDLLQWYQIEYNDDSSLGDLETEFWDKLFSPPNDRFHDDQYAKSPWWDRCCREERTVRSLKQKGDWDELWLKVVPRKTVNFVSALLANPDPGQGGAVVGAEPQPRPTNVGVSQFDLNRLGLRLLREPIYTTEVAQALRAEGREEALLELKVMALLRA
jgi:hypothetical protein